MRHFLLLILFSLLCLSRASLAEPAVHVTATKDAIRIDGSLDETAWKKVSPAITQFIQYRPTEGGTPPGKTEIFLMQDDKNLYVGIRVSELNYQPLARVSPREQINDDDQIGIYLDTFGDARTGYMFYFNPLGIQQDIRYANGNWFFEWNMVYHSRGKVNAAKDGYEIEIAFPFRSLQYPKQTQQNWKIIVTRKVPSMGTKYGFPKLKRRHPRMFAQGAPLVIKPPPQNNNISVQPTVVSQTRQQRNEQSKLLWNEEAEMMDYLRPSADFRWRITPNSSITATLNPDFSQIEGDVPQINLNQRFAFYFPERRPFFLDNLEYFSDVGSTLYSRSIVEPLYGVKASGQEGKWGFALLHAMDQSPASSFHENGTPGFSEEEIGGRMAENTYIRLRRNAFQAGFIGLFFADKRILDKEAPLGEKTGEFTGGYSDVLGMDMEIPIHNIWTIRNAASLSWAGSQDNPLTGHHARLSIERDPALGTGIDLNMSTSSADYRREIGFLTLSGAQQLDSSLNYSHLLHKELVSTPGVKSKVTLEDDQDKQAFVGYEHRFQLRGLHSLYGYAGPTWNQFEGNSVQGYDIKLRYKSRISNSLRYKLSAEHSKTIDYSSLLPANITTLDGGVILRPTQGILLDLSTYQQFLISPNQEEQRAARYYSKVNWQFLPSFGARFIQQSTTSTEEDQPSISTSLLFTWLRNPGTEAYVGALWNIAGEETLELQEQLFFVKYTHLFQL